MTVADSPSIDVRDVIENVSFAFTLCSAGEGTRSQSINVGEEIHRDAEVTVRSSPLSQLTLGSCTAGRPAVRVFPGFDDTEVAGAAIGTGRLVRMYGDKLPPGIRL
jgi:hypothetical protein